MPASGPNNFTKEALDHAWNWFALHAGQRMQSFNFFLVATAFLIAAYGALLEKHAGIATGIAILGAWNSYWFNRLEKRTKQLVKGGEAALKGSQKQLAELSGIPEMAILERIEAKSPGSSSYSIVINVIQWTVLVAFALS